MTSFLTPNFNLPDIAPQKYKLVLTPEIINSNSFNYQFYDVNDKRLKFAKIYSPFSHFKSGFEFKGENDPNKNNKVLIRLIDNSKIRCIFLYPKNKQWQIEKNLYRDMNTKFISTGSGGRSRWDSTHPKLFLLAEEKTLKGEVFDTPSFMKQLYWDKHVVTDQNGKYPVIGTPLTSVLSGHAQPFIQRQLKLTLKKEGAFWIYGSPDNKKHNIGFDSVIDNCKYYGNHVLTNDDKKIIEENFPNFSFNTLSQYYVGKRSIDTQWKPNDLLFPSATETPNNSSNIFDPRTQFMKFRSENIKYKDYLDSNNGVFFFESVKDLPGDIDDCEKLFDKDVLEIKKLVNDIGLLKEITEYEQLNLGLYDDENIIDETFIQRLNKKIQIYGFISIPFVQNKKNHLVTLKNLLPFRVKDNIQKEKLTFQLAYLEKEDRILTSDQKIHNLSIVCVKKKKHGIY